MNPLKRDFIRQLKNFDLTPSQRKKLLKQFCSDWDVRKGILCAKKLEKIRKEVKKSKLPKKESLEIIHIYSLDVKDIPVYIGKTFNIERRFREHRSHRKKVGRKKYIIGFSDIYLSLPAKFQINLIDSVPKDEWKFWEKYYISLYQSFGFKLINIRPGGI